ncbi:MAG: hypothetical protein JWO30_2905 [Fibrobacteres bacterium]|nr:hypothetical protein [Fibrobacterota bacterium]
MFKQSTRLIGLLTLIALGPTIRAQVVATIPGFRATYPAGKIGGSSTTGIPANYVKIPPANEYYLDYEVSFESGWAWVKGGKLPGLVGGAHTSGCEPIVQDGWSARFMWHEGGGAHFYYYHQNRANDCGDVINFSGSPTLKTTGWNRITEHVVVNTPGQSNGSAEAWFNGKKVITLGNIKWRGNVAATVAMVDQVSLQTFYGGSTNDWAPSQTTHSQFNGFVVRKDLPDFTIPFEAVTTGVVIGEDRAEISGQGRGYAVAYLGNGKTPALPEGRIGSKAGLFDLHGRSVANLAWTEGQWKSGSDARWPNRPGVMIVRLAL